MKRLGFTALLLVCMHLFSITAGAFAERVDKRKVIIRDLSTDSDLICDDFNTFSPGTLPGYVTYCPSQSEITTKKIIGPSGKMQNVLVLADGDGGTAYLGPVVTKSFPAVSSGMVAFETRFKIERTGQHTHAGMGMYLRQGTSIVTRLLVSGSTDGSFSYSTAIGNGVNLTNKKMLEPGVWYKVRLLVDLDTKKVSVILESEALQTKYVYYENLSLYDSFDSISLDNLRIECRQYDATYYYDYIKVEAGDNLEIEVPENRVRPTPIQPPISNAPVMRAVPNRNNVCVNGEYMYFYTKPVLDGNDLMVTVSSAFRVFSLIEINDGNGLSAQGEGVTAELKKDSAEIIINGKKSVMSKPVVEQDGQLMISLNELAKAMGYTASWSSEENTLFISGGEGSESLEN